MAEYPNVPACMNDLILWHSFHINLLEFIVSKVGNIKFLSSSKSSFCIVRLPQWRTPPCGLGWNGRLLGGHRSGSVPAEQWLWVGVRSGHHHGSRWDVR